jgi:hypothetical protein
MLDNSDPVGEEDRLLIGEGDVCLATDAAAATVVVIGGGTHIIRLQSSTSIFFRFCQMRYRHIQC